MSARMPIAAALLAGRHCAYMGSVLEKLGKSKPHDVIGVKPVENVVQESVLRSLHNSVPFDIQVASELYWGKPKDYYEISEFDGMRLPYRQVWFEWGIPELGYHGGRKYQEPHSPARFAANLFESEADPSETPPGADRTIFVQVLAEPQNDDQPPGSERPILLNEVPLRFCVDADGKYIEGTIVEYRPQDLSHETNELLVGEAKSAAIVCAMALQLINCRNVTTAKAGNIAVRRSGRQKRQGVQPTAFHTIVLPGMSVERGKVTKQQAAANEAALRLHRVRGHFKTFTNEAPLLGKHVGRYWWNPAVRGNAKRGTVSADYRVGERV